MSNEAFLEERSEVPEEVSLDRSRVNFVLRKRFRNLTGTRRLGIFWLALDPLVISLIYLFVFSVLRANPSISTLLIGITLYRVFSESVKSGVVSIRDFTGGFKSERVRTSVLVSSIIRFRIIDSALKSLPTAIILIVSLGTPLTGTLLYLIIAQILGLIAEGSSMNLSLLTRRVPDLSNIINHALLLGFFVSPSLYPMHLTKGLHYRFNEFNPVAHFIELSRHFCELDSEIGNIDHRIVIVFWILFLSLSVRGYYGVDRMRWELSSWS